MSSNGISVEVIFANYGIDLNAASGTPITVWNPATNQYQNYTINGRYDGSSAAHEVIGGVLSLCVDFHLVSLLSQFLFYLGYPDCWLIQRVGRYSNASLQHGRR